MLLEVRNITKTFGEKTAVNNVSFSAKSGIAFGLLGRNGAGKTTTIRMIMDFFKPDSGEILFDGQKIKNLKVGYLPEERGLYPKKQILEQLVYIGELKGMRPSDAKKNAKTILERLGATEYLHKKLDTLSKGNQQKIQLATALINEPDIIILDEPFSGLDPINSQILKDVVRETVDSGKFVVFSSHQMAQVEQFCDEICILNYGNNVLTGNLRDIKRSYPRNKVLIELDDPNSFKTIKEVLENTGTQNYIQDIQELRNGCVVTLKEEKLKEQLLTNLFKSGKVINKFEVVEPTLEQIFIEKAQDKQDAHKEVKE